MGLGQIFPEKCCEDVQFNVCSITTEWVHVKFLEKSITKHLNGPLPLRDRTKYAIKVRHDAKRALWRKYYEKQRVQSVGPFKALYTSSPGRPVHSNTNSTCLGSKLALSHNLITAVYSFRYFLRFSLIHLSELRHCGGNKIVKHSKWYERGFGPGLPRLRVSRSTDEILVNLVLTEHTHYLMVCYINLLSLLVILCRSSRDKN